MPAAIAQYVADIAPVIRDDGGLVPSADLTRFVIQTIIQRYSKDAPFEVISDAPGNGTPLVSLPVAPDGVEAVWEKGFSYIRTIEWPTGQQPPQYMEDNDFREYWSPTGGSIYMGADTPQLTDTLRMTWTARHATDGTTVYPQDYYAIVDYAASMALEAMASICIQTGDSTIGADVVNYRTKAQEYLTQSKAVRKRYFTHMGVEESATAEAGEAKPAIVVGNQYMEQGSGVDRLVHGRYTR